MNFSGITVHTADTEKGRVNLGRLVQINTMESKLPAANWVIEIIKRNEICIF